MRSETEGWTVLENLPCGFFRSTPEGRILIANKALAAMFGYTSGSEIIESVRDIGRELYLEKQDREVLVQTLARTGLAKNFEARMRKKDGTPFWACINARAISDPRGQLYFEGTLADITERKGREEKLETELKEMKNLLECAPMGIAVIYKNLRYLYINPTFTKMFGYDLSDLPDRDVWYEKAYSDEAYRESMRLEWRLGLESLQRGEYRLSKIKVRCKDNSIKTVRVYGTSLGNETYLICYEDVTHVEEIETRYRLIFENAEVGIFQISRDWRFLLANPCLVTRLGYSSFEEMVGSIKDLGTQVFADPDEKKRIEELIRKEGVLKRHEVECIRNDGSKIWVSLDVWPVYDTSGQFLYYQGIAQDVTEAKEKEAEYRSLQQQFIQAQKMEAIGTLAGGIAHDFNNILTVVLGSATILKSRIRDSADVRYIDQIISACHTAADLIKDLLTFSRRQPIRLAPMEINREIEDMKGLLRRLTPESVELTILPCERPCYVLADRTQLRQVFLNLLSNAKDAMPDGGTITIRVDRFTMTEEFVEKQGFGTCGEYVVVSFKDTGTGIDKAVLPKIFEPFFTTKEMGKGTGMGLATVYGIVKQHNGYITVESEKGLGTTFHVYLPFAPARPSEERMVSWSMPLVRGKGERILLVEDNDDIRGLIREFLQSAGYKVKEAKDGEEALSLMDEGERFDLIISDVVMPKRSGKDVYLEARKRNRETRVILISGYGAQTVPDVSFEDGYTDFLQKPISLEVLARKVRQLLDRGSRGGGKDINVT